MKETRQMENIEELLDFFLVANDETRRNVTGLMKVHTLLLLFILKNYLSIFDNNTSYDMTQKNVIALYNFI